MFAVGGRRVGDPLPDPPPRRVTEWRAGALLGRYRLVERVGCGAAADVWRARDELLERDVAVKRFRAQRPPDALEARLVARLRHPNVVAVHDLIQDGSSYCLVMDFHDGVDLGELLGRGRRLPPRVVAALGLQLLAALEAVHGSGVVHCDVKPANLVLGHDGRLILVDFGIAEISGGEPTHPARRDGYVVGSPGYTAPELLRGRAPCPASDMWSVGAVLYTAVEGRSPFQHDGVVPTVAAVLHDRPPPPRRAGCLRPLLEQLLAKDPAARPSVDAARAMLAGTVPLLHQPAVCVRDSKRTTGQ
jgi:serine/threonine protein kinase